ncbi:hypothetical protein ACJRO7_001368 [Eucalyptus globulus]|uniref:CCHC-type domain-containing protein n=1 Tax=Eucalyptus globulus TaxID=34317 RepID=A0ABD3LRP0_EUCGL
MEEFQRLRQGSMTVDQYGVKFAELSQYAPRLIEDPEEKARRFRNGLRAELKQPLLPLDLVDYREVYRRAQMIERGILEQAASSGSRFSSHRDNIRQGKRPMFGNRFQSPPSKRSGFNRPGPIRNDACRLCGRRHEAGPCPARTGACFECGQQGHIARYCPKKQRGQPQLPPPPPLRQIGGYAPQNALRGGQQRPPAQGTVYAITQGQAEAAPGVITGTVSLNDQPAYALFDSGATHSFIAEQYVRMLGLNPVLLESAICISTPLKDKVIAALGCLGCKLEIGERVGKIDLLVLAMYDFDLIIGMDWLTNQ